MSVEAVQDKFVVVCVVPEAVKFVGADGATVSVDPAVIVKLVLETSKKMWFVPLTINLAVVEGVLGIVIACVRSFGVAAKTVDQVFPPSVEIKISTLAQFTLLAVVPASFQVTICELPPA